MLNNDIIFYVFIIMSNNPVVTPYKTKEYTFTQSNYDIAPRIPFSMVTTGQSGSGKTVLLSNLIFNIYRGCFSRIFIWSSSIDLDPVWTPVKDYVENTLKVDTNKEKVFFDPFNIDEMQKVLDLQHKINRYQKKSGCTKLYSVLFLIGDFIDQASFAKHNNLLNALYIKARHYGVNISSSSQKYNGLSTTIRTSSRQFIFLKLRNYKEVESVLDELAGVFISKKAMSDTKSLHQAKQILLEIYNVATEETFHFLFVNLVQSDINKMFMKNFTSYTQISEDE